MHPVLYALGQCHYSPRGARSGRVVLAVGQGPDKTGKSNVLGALYLLARTMPLIVYRLPYAEAKASALLLLLAVSIWQGILLWKARPGEMPERLLQLESSAPRSQGDL